MQNASSSPASAIQRPTSAPEASRSLIRAGGVRVGLVLSAIALAAAVPTRGRAEIIHVPADYPTVAGALLAAQAGDEIVLACQEHVGPAVLGPDRDGVIIRAATDGCATYTGRLELESSVTIEGLLFDAGDVFHDGSMEPIELRIRRTRFTGAPQPIWVGSADVDLTDVVVDQGGLTIQAGRVRISGSTFITHGVMAPSLSSLTIENSTFGDGRTLCQSYMGLDPEGTFEISDCHFQHSTVQINPDTSSDAPVITFRGCTFEDGRQGRRAIHATYVGAVFEDCSFLGNAGVAVRIDRARHPVQLDSCRFVGNGEALQIFSPLQPVQLRSCVFLESDRGAVHLGLGATGEASFVGCTFSRNVGSAGAIANGWYGLAGGRIRIEESTFFENAANSQYGVAHINARDAELVMSECVVYGGTGTCSVATGEGAVDVSCTDIYGIENGHDWTGCSASLAAQLGAHGNVSSDPMFCREDPHGAEDWSVDEASPTQVDGCAMGAWPASSCVVPIESVSWGRLKSSYR